MTIYSLTCINNSTQKTNLCLYQQLENQGNFYSLAWFSKTCHPKTSVEFKWSDALYFVWGLAQEIHPNDCINISQSEIATSDTIHFLKEENAYRFDTLTTNPDNKNLKIKTDESICKDEAVVGIGMMHTVKGISSSIGTIIAPADPNLTYAFSSKIGYFLTFGNLEKGQILDPSSINSQELIFKNNEYNLIATLNEENIWEISKPHDSIN